MGIRSVPVRVQASTPQSEAGDHELRLFCHPFCELKSWRLPDAVRALAGGKKKKDGGGRPASGPPRA